LERRNALWLALTAPGQVTLEERPLRECEGSVGEWKLAKAKESATVDLHINALHGKPAGWANCTAGALGTVE
jgi:hypothetical protein